MQIISTTGSITSLIIISVNFKIIIPLNNDIKKHTQRGALEYVSVRDQLFTPVKRENKIRIVKISPANVIVSGF